MKFMKFGDLPPGTIWRMSDDDGWWLKVDARHVYGACHQGPEKDKGWSIQISGPGLKELAGLLLWTSNHHDVIVWDGKEDLNG